MSEAVERRNTWIAAQGGMFFAGYVYPQRFGDSDMRGSVSFLAIVLIVIAVVGFYRGWFTMEQVGQEPRPGVQITLDKDKMKQDAQRAEKRLESIGTRVAPPKR
jgi:hypothetical protein